ncbi:MAG: DUF998 domain-containing protein [Baekduia sp.]
MLPNVVARGALVVFVTLLIAEHAINSELSPGRHQISEYVHGDAGWTMTAAFVAWAVSLGATAVDVGRWSRVAGILISVAAAGMLVTAGWATQTSAGELPPGVSVTMAGRLHNLGSGAASAALLAATIVSAAVGPTRWLRRAAIGLVSVAVASDLLLLVVGASVGGLRQRVLVLTAIAWQAVVLADRDRES